MTKPFRIALAVLGVLSAAYHSAPAATPAPPKVVFIGDYLTAGWTSGFAANPNWINQAYPTPDSYSGGRSADLLAQFQSDVVNLHPAIVHIMVGAVDAALEDDGTTPIVTTVFANNIMGMIELAKAANIKVILATTPAGSPGNIGITQMNAFVEAYGAANGIPVINYADALCDCVNSVAAVGYGNAISSTSYGYAFPPVTPGPQNYQPQPLMTTTTNNVPGGYPAIPIPTAAGYALMTQLAENAIATMGLTLKSGWLQDIDFGMGVGVDDNVPLFNQNTVFPGMTLQFTPWGLYSDGVSRPLLNSNFAGSSGTWTSSNPTVMYVTQTGVAYALSPGQSWIRYVSPNGVAFSPWVMTVNSAIPIN